MEESSIRILEKKQGCKTEKRARTEQFTSNSIKALNDRTFKKSVETLRRRAGWSSC